MTVELQVAQIKNEASELVQMAMQVQVHSKEDCAAAEAIGGRVKAIRTAWTDYWGPLKKRTHDAWKDVVAKEKEGTDLCDRAERAVKYALLEWQQAEARKAAELQRKLQAEADEKARRERERLEREAANLKTEEKRAERLAQAAAVTAPVVTIAAPTVKGMRTTWKAELVNKEALIAAAPTNALVASLLTFDQKAADAFARSTRGQVTVPGVRFVEDKSLAMRSA